MAIPLRDGLQIRCAFQGTREQGKLFAEKIKPFGHIRELNEEDHQRQKQDRVGGASCPVGDVKGQCVKKRFTSGLTPSLARPGPAAVG